MWSINFKNDSTNSTGHVVYFKIVSDHEIWHPYVKVMASGVASCAINGKTLMSSRMRTLNSCGYILDAMPYPRYSYPYEFNVRIACLAIPPTQVKVKSEEYNKSTIYIYNLVRMLKLRIDFRSRFSIVHEYQK